MNHRQTEPNKCANCGAHVHQSREQLARGVADQATINKLTARVAELERLRATKTGQEDDKRAQLLQRVTVAEAEANAARKDAAEATRRLRQTHDAIQAFIEHSLEQSFQTSALGGIAKAQRAERDAQAETVTQSVTSESREPPPAPGAGDE